jgi:acyl-CoA synthetase (NDP forming)
MHPSIERAHREGRHLLEPEALGLLEEHGISVPRHAFVRTKAEALLAAKHLGWPLVMKVVAPHILHKTEIGGVILPINSEKELTKAFSRLVSLDGADSKVEGVLVCPYQPHETEVSVGMIRDSQFGPVITFGLGGIWVEVFGDLTYGIAPLSSAEAEAMVHSTRGYPVLAGERGRKASDAQALCQLLVSLSRMVLEEEAIQEIDLNPVLPLERGYFIADARIILGKG